MVKLKTEIFRNFTAGGRGPSLWLLPVLSLLTFISSWLAVYPPRLVEGWYARGLFPRISHLAGAVADLFSISWLDLGIPLGMALVITLIYQRRWRWLLNLTAGLYLIFFWSWGLNYHRQALSSKLPLDSSRMQNDAIERFARRAAAEMNRLYLEKQKESYNDSRSREEASRRVRRVVGIIDGSDWTAAQRIKISWIGNPWLHAAGIDGVFNPLVHEPIISNSVLDIERPFVMAHELAHVRGYTDEGDANVIASLATLMSDQPAFQYSGWLNLWLYLRTSELDKLLDSGPRSDLQRMFDRARAEQIRWINAFQTSLLDWFLKANSVEEGVRSYSRVVVLVAATEPSWEHYR